MPVAVIICLTVVIFFAILTPFMIMEHRKEKKIEEELDKDREMRYKILEEFRVVNIENKRLENERLKAEIAALKRSVKHKPTKTKKKV